MMVIENKFNIGQTVYLVTDNDQNPRIVISLQIYSGNMMYLLSKGGETSAHYDFEISETLNELLKVK